MRFIILFFLSLSNLHAEGFIRSFDLKTGAGTSPLTVTGEAPIFELKLLNVDANKKQESTYYMFLVQIDVCHELGRIPKLLNNHQTGHNNIVNHAFEFKCVPGENSDHAETVKAKCTNEKDPNFRQICDSLSSRYGRQFITCKKGTCNQVIELD